MLNVALLVVAPLVLGAAAAFLLCRRLRPPTSLTAARARPHVRGRCTEVRGGDHRDDDHWSSGDSDESSYDEDDGTDSCAREGEPVRRARGGTQASRLRQARARRSAGDGDGLPREENADSVGDHTRLSRLQKKKQQRERERQERQEAHEALLESRRVRKEAEEQKERDREREERERAAVEEAALRELRAEKKRQEDAEYAKWVSAIGVEERGEIGDEERVKRDNLIKYLTNMAVSGRGHGTKQAADSRSCSGDEKVYGGGETGNTEGSVGGNILVLSDVARAHGVSVETLVKVIEELLESDTVGGVFDDRGKFVMVSNVHYDKIAEFVRLRGRVSVKELARECNRVILS